MRNKLMYLRDNSNNPVGCLAFAFDKENSKLSYQFSANHLDSFSKRSGRELAVGKLVLNPLVIEGVNLDANEKAFPQLVHLIMTNISKMEPSLMISQHLPLRAKKLANYWLGRASKLLAVKEVEKEVEKLFQV